MSSEFCQAHLGLLFKLLQNSQSPIIRSNIIIGIGDLAISFNSLVDPNISLLYSRLSDSNFQVKKNAFMVLTFLILNGMVKVKGQISEMAKCLEDEDERIRGLARLFFTELAQKDNAIYNNLPDIISNLVDIPQERYRKIMKYVMGFIVKEKQNESVVEKLCLRFKHTNSPRAWSDVAFCLSLLSFGTEKGLKKLIDALPLYQDKLYCEPVYHSLLDILNKIKASLKPEIKTIAESFRETLAQEQAKSLENYKATLEAANAKVPQIAVQMDMESTTEFPVVGRLSTTPSSPSQMGSVIQNEAELANSDSEILANSKEQLDPSEKMHVEQDDSDATASEAETPIRGSKNRKTPMKKTPTMRARRSAKKRFIDSYSG